MLANKRQCFIFVGCCLVIAVAVFALPGYRYVKQFNAERYARIANEHIEAGDFAAAKEKVHAAYHLAPNNAEVLLLQADWLLRNGQVDEALTFAQRLVRLPDVPQHAHLFYVQLSQFADDIGSRNEGLAYLRELAQRNDALGLEALRNVVRYEHNTTAQVREIVDLVQMHPLSGRKDQLLALQTLINLAGTDVEQIIAQAKSYFDLEDLAHLLELGSWFNSVNLHAATVQTVSLAHARLRKDLFLVRLDAMAALNMWEAVGIALDDPDIPIDRYMQLLFAARVSLETGFPDKADIAWNRAQQAVANEPKKLWLLANYAQSLNLFKEARSVLERLIEIPSSMRQAYEALILLELQQGDTRRLRDTFARMVEIYPADVAVLNDLAYTNLLLNENIATACARAQRLVALNPKYLANHITLALAYYRSNNSEHALEVLGAVDVDWARVKVGWRAVYAAILRDSGLNTEAEAMLTNIDLSMLLPEEKKLLSRG